MLNFKKKIIYEKQSNFQTGEREEGGGRV